MVMDNKRKAEDSGLVPANKKQKNEISVKNKNNQVLQAVSLQDSFWLVLLHFIIFRPLQEHLICLPL